MKKYVPIFFILMWQIISMIVNNSIIVPSILEIIQAMCSYLTQPKFYMSILFTMQRVIIGIVISLLLAFILGIFSYKNRYVKEIVEPIVSFLQTIPQISYIVILLVWCKSEVALYVILLFMLFPIGYHNILQGLENIDDDLVDVIILYHQPLFFNIRKVYLPMIKPYIMATLDSIIPLSIKVIVMSEIFVSSSQGIGRLLYFARVQIDTASILALTIYMVLIIQGLLYIYKIITKRT